MKSIGPCVACGRSVVYARDYTAEDRDAGLLIHAGRGLCHRCRSQAQRMGRLDEYPRRSRSRSEVLEDWEFLQQQLPRDISHTRRIQLAAERLGMSPAALERMLRRAGIRATTIREDTA